MRQIGQAVQSLRSKLDWVKRPLSELRIVSNGRTIAVHVAGQKMEAISGQILLDFEASSLGGVRAFPDRKSAANRLRESETWFQKGLELEETGAPIEEAIEAYTKVLECNPGAAGALVNLGTIFIASENSPKPRNITRAPSRPIPNTRWRNSTWAICSTRGAGGGSAGALPPGAGLERQLRRCALQPGAACASAWAMP